MVHDTAATYRRIAKAFTEGDRATLEELIAEDVVWHTDSHQDAPDEFRGRDAFFAVADQPRELFASWEVIPYAVLGDGTVAFAHQIDRVVFPDGRKQEVRFNLYMEFNDRGQLREAWEFGQTHFV